MYEGSCVLRAETIPFSVGGQLLSEAAKSGLWKISLRYYYQTLTISKDWLRQTLSLGFLQTGFKTDIPYWLLEILTYCVWLIHGGAENWVFSKTVTVPNDGYFPSPYSHSKALFPGSSRITEFIWWAHFFISHYVCYLQFGRTQGPASKWFVWIFLTTDKA